MTLSIISGDIGSGKSLLCCYFAMVGHSMDKTIYSNLHFKFPYQKLLLEELVDLKTGEIILDLQDAVVIIDEAYLWLESRLSTSKRNRIISYFLLQSRKRNLDVFLVAHSPHQLDKRARQNCDILYTTEFSGHPQHGRKGDKVRVTRRDLSGPTGNKKFIIDAAKLWPWFDSNQIFPISQ